MSNSLTTSHEGQRSVYSEAVITSRTMHRNKLLISFVLCNLLQKGLTAHDSDGHQHKYFLPNTKFDNPLNWDTKRTPCANDRAIIPHDSKVPVYVATDLRIRQLVLATDGEVILAANASLLVTDVSSDKCSGKDVYFEVNSVKSWHDPSNWRFTEEDAEPIIPVPDVERTPCQDDHIVFPVNSSFQVAVDGQDALLQILTVNGLTMAAVDFQGYTDTKSGRMRFKLNKGITFSSNECNEPSGCICKNTNIPERKEYICGFLKGKCPQLRCDDPISPTGSCCPTCASMYLATIDNAFIMSNFRDYVINRLELKGIAETCQIFISRVSANSVQLVARDMIKHSDQEFITHLENNFKKGHRFAGVVGVKVQVSQNWLPSGDFYTGNKGFTAGPVAALILGFLTAIIIAALLFVHYRKQWYKKKSPFSI